MPDISISDLKNSPFSKNEDIEKFEQKIRDDLQAQREIATLLVKDNSNEIKRLLRDSLSLLDLEYIPDAQQCIEQALQLLI